MNKETKKEIADEYLRYKKSELHVDINEWKINLDSEWWLLKIDQLLTSQKKELVEKIHRRVNKEYTMSISAPRGVNEMVNDIINIINLN